MSIKKKLGMSVATAALGLSLVAGGTFAYFSDSEKIENTFASGTLDLGLSTDKHGDLNFGVENLKPGDKMVRQVRLMNEGSLNIKDVNLQTNYEIDGEEDFASQILVTIHEPRTKPIVDKVPLDELEEKILAESLEPGERSIYVLNFEFAETGEDQNRFQENTLDLTMTYEANQEDGEIR